MLKVQIAASDGIVVSIHVEGTILWESDVTKGCVRVAR
jgi:hypothetical protein